MSLRKRPQRNWLLVSLFVSVSFVIFNLLLPGACLTGCDIGREFEIPDEYTQVIVHPVAVTSKGNGHVYSVCIADMAFVVVIRYGYQGAAEVVQVLDVNGKPKTCAVERTRQ